jgi:hypothetical protein
MRKGNAMTPATSGETPLYLPEPLSMIDEERDIDAFKQYLRELSPEALWDVYAHLDEDRYPRRHEAVRREINGRRLLYFPLYSEFEARLRTLFFVAVIFSLLAAIMHGIPMALAATAKVSQHFGGDTVAGSGSIGYEEAMRRALAFSSLSYRELVTYRNLSTFFRGLTELSLIGISILLPFAAYQAARRRLRLDVVITGLLCATLAGGLLRFALR